METEMIHPAGTSRGYYGGNEQEHRKYGADGCFLHVRQMKITELKGNRTSTSSYRPQKLLLQPCNEAHMRN